MKCPRCQQDNPAHARFCLGCGARLALVCASCGAELPGGARFCLQCGQAVAAGPEASVRSPAPETYTPKHLAEKILTSKAALEGERKQVTVLFADLKGSMELLADRDPEEARKLLDPVLERMMEAVHRYEGTVNQVMGDGIMALFGAPLAHEDHAVRACYAALRMQETVKRYSEELRRSHGIEVQIRVGLNSGEVVVRSIGSDLHMDYTAVGQTTHLAARMEQLATPGSIRLTADTLRLVEGYIEVKSLGPVPIKGCGAPVEVYEVTGAGAVRSRLQAAAARGFTRFVGRDAEVEQLRKALDHSRAGHGQLVATVGEPGVGKSRLFHEFTHSHRTQDWLILESGSVSYGKATSYLAVIDLLKGYFKVHDRETHREIREKVTGKLLTLDRALEPTLPALLALLDVPVDDAPWQALDPSQRRRLTLDAVKRLLLRESQLQPLLVIFEDLHWIDSETEALLDGLVESLPTARLLLLVNYRPEYQHGWGSKTYYTQLRLDALPPESANELLLALLGTDATVEPLKPVLIARTGGNPLFLEESVRTLVETHALTGERGALRLVRPLDTIDVPATVQAILASRIDRLGPQDKQLLQTASVIGKDVPFALLLAIAELDEEDLRRGLARLQTAEFLYEARLFPDLEYTFKHALTHEVAYGSLLQERRRALHALIIHAMERLYAERVVEHVERLAHHALHGELWEKALAYLRQSGSRAIERLAFPEAAAYLEQALAAAARLPRGREVLEQSIDARIALRLVLFNLGEFDRVRDHLSQAAAIAREIGDQVRLAQVTAFQAHYYCIMVGEMPEALDCARRAMTIAEASDTPVVIGLARDSLGRVQHGFGDYRGAIATLKKNVESLRGDLANERWGHAGPISVFSRVWLVFALADVGEFSEAFAVAEQALEQAEALGHPYSLFHAYWAWAAIHLEKGNHERAAEAASRATRAATESNNTRLNQRGILAHALALAGRPLEGVKLLEELLVVPSGRRNAFTGQRDVLYLGDSYLRAGRLDDALRMVQRELDVARTSSQRGREAQALRLLGDIHTARGEADQALESYGHALALATDLGMRPLVAHCHLGLGRLYLRTGKREPAHEHITTAATMYREMDMRFWLEQAEAEMKGLG
jgi:class 3 adenylate cyclase/tetratricopeptide (TPR) repeat protein